MGHVTDKRREEVLVLATKTLHAAAPGLVPMKDLATQIGGQLGIPFQSARRYLRANVRHGFLVELCPDTEWRVCLPDSPVGDLFIAFQLYQCGEREERTRLVLAHPSSGLRPRHYPPVQPVSYLTTKEQVNLFVKRVQSKERRLAKAQ